MIPIKNLQALLKSMKPKLIKEEYIFYTTKKLNTKLNPICIFQEKEGTTLIIKKDDADKNNIKYQAVWNLITLTVHSDLEAIGFLAKITEKLAKNNISVNVISAYYHDHLFILKKDSKKTMQILNKF